MEFYTALALITVGVGFISGVINLVSGLSADGEKTETVFGVLVLSVAIFLVLPPLGYITNDRAPYPPSLDIKRIFMWVYYALLPVFFEYYSGYRKPFLKYSIWSLLITSYAVMAFTRQDSMKPVWLMIILVMFGLVGYYGLVAGIKLLATPKRSEGKWLITSMIIFLMLYVLGLINQLGDNYFGKKLGSELFFPFHFNLISFIVIMSIRLRTNTNEKFRLEKILRWKDSRWNSLEENLRLIIVELDSRGSISYINPFALSTFGYLSDEMLKNKNWFDHFYSKQQSNMLKSDFCDSLKEGKAPPIFLSQVTSRTGKELSINWTTVFIYDKQGQINGTMNIGVDLTQQENAYREVRMLKNELEKENLELTGLKNRAEIDEDIIGTSDTIIYAINKALEVATTNAGVLLQGETGVGKEVFADFIHKNSYRSTKSLIKLNCAALPADLVESEFFGHEKGSFTGAIQSRIGRFELADEGTIFLDEIGELSLSLQSKLLRVLQNGEFQRVGGQKTIKVNVRIIAATNRPLQEETKLGKFREDLFYRLNVFPITIPPLRKRKEDIPLLMAHFVKKLSHEHHKTIENVSKADMSKLVDYEWPGNVREMINLIERSVILSHGSTLKLDWLNSPSPAEEIETEEVASIYALEKNHIAKILRECNWKINGNDGAASRLGLHPNTLRSRLKRMNITRSSL